jgi:hypothetical protein
MRGSIFSLSGNEVLIHGIFVLNGKEKRYSHEFRIGVGSSTGESVNGESSGSVFVVATLVQSDERLGRWCESLTDGT